ncbi:MAG TPA: FecR family protein [Myxococcales bacterium]
MSGPRQKLPAQIALVVLAGLAVALLVFRLGMYERPASPRADAAAAPGARSSDAGVRALVLSVEGEVQRGTAAGPWMKLAPGHLVRPDELLRTGANGRTDLSIGQRSRLTIGAASEVKIQELTGMVHRFRLTRGQMIADYEAEGQRVLRVEDGRGEAVAEARSARFSVLSTGTAIAVATSAGEVELRSHRRAVRIAAGQQAVAMSGASPSPARPIPTAVLLKIANAATAGSDDVCAEIDGQAAPGSEVTVDGEPVQLGPDGHFRRKVARERHKRAAVVAIRDAAGREQTRSVPCSAPPAPIRDMAIHWGRKP